MGLKIEYMQINYGENFKVGVLGAGQLGKMLAQIAPNYDVKIYAMDSSEKAPAAQLVHNFTLGDIKNFDEVYNFGKDKDVLTVEIEHVNTEALKKLEKEGVKVYPKPDNLKLIQDKGLQKEFYQKIDVPTAPFRLITSKEELNNHSDFLPFFQKLRKGGYDGKGVFNVQSENDFEDALEGISLLEKYVDFEIELSLIVARNENQEVVFYPLVACEFNKNLNLVEFLYSPADVSQELSKKAQEIGKKIVEGLDFIGILAIELFLTKDGELLVNEIAPRTHNSGHHTIEANYTSQFEQHLRAICNFPLGNTELRSAGVMINLIGEEGYLGVPFYEGLEKVMKMKGVYPHIYGKNLTKPGRKMGHITVINKNLNQAKSKAREIQQILKVKSQPK